MGWMKKSQRQGQISAGVMIIISPDLTRAWTRAGKLKPITSSPTSKFPGRTIVITISFPNKSNRLTDTYHRKTKGNIKIFLCSIYHPHEIDKQKKFINELDQFITNRPMNLEILMESDINCNVGVTSKLFSDPLRPHGINNRNIKWSELLYLYKTNNLKILLSYFKHNNYITYRSFNDKSQHICRTTLYVAVNYSKGLVTTKVQN